jgi:2,4-dienoyl-CoA reductase-like NADH-dependent reductase (Old Yellow Enzyme family)
MLLEPCELDGLGKLNSRVVMSAATRGFCGPGHTATDDMAEYYARRARDGVGLILTEGTIIHPSGDGYNDVPHIHDAAQTESWKKVTARVHEEGGTIYSQLWHCGRISHPDYTGGEPPVSPTGRAAEGINRQNDKPFGTPRALETDEMPAVYAQYRNAAKNALAAGFDGVQIHMAHGYLVDEFFDARINDREDRYGGTVENRCRFALECLEDVLAEAGPERTMIRISPARFMGGPYDWPDKDEMVDYLIGALDGLGLRMLDISCANADYFQTSGPVIRSVRPRWKHVLIGGASLAADDAENELREGHLDMVTWARAIIANPDFITRLKAGEALIPFERELLGRLY